jgi:hypothetical protein
MCCMVKSASTSRDAPASPTTLKQPYTNDPEYRNHYITEFDDSIGRIGVHSNRPELKESLCKRLGVIPYESCTVQRTATRVIGCFATGSTGSTVLGRKETGYALSSTEVNVEHYCVSQELVGAATAYYQ